ncbi:GH16 domain-containing protein [Mycena indigotica]|uniref:GH16 domain-containing protein n=1 Tax=Mycena indigotica TaxID=2126181 RepID=A0A8H6W5F0_9AGAR|nr:GH16 domain-containing protein [Mycena indigotica]KAF7303511.1 GH16 domain-containing protein [Mycena indigotica]
MSRYSYDPLAIEDDDRRSRGSSLPPASSSATRLIPRKPPPRVSSRSPSPLLDATPTPLGPRLRVTRSPSPSTGSSRPPSTDFDVDFVPMSPQPSSRNAHARTDSSASLLPPPPRYSGDISPAFSHASLPLPPSDYSDRSRSHSPPSDYSDGEEEDGDMRFEAPRPLPAPLPRPRSLLQADPPTPHATSSPFSFTSSALPPATNYSDSPYALPPRLPSPDKDYLDVPFRPRYPRAGSVVSEGVARPSHRRGGPAGLGSMGGSSEHSSIDFSAGSRPGSAPPEKFDAFAYSLHLGPEDDDALHDPRVKFSGVYTRFAGVSVFTARGVLNLGCLVLLVAILAVLFLVYPLHLYFTAAKPGQALVGSSTTSGVNASGQVPSIGNFGLVDLHTPKSAYSLPSYHDPSQTLQLVFSDEFEEEGRSFYPGDDPYWEAVDLHYWQTGNLEWYDPSMISTRGGALEINLTKVADPTTNHGLNYKGGMMSTWNKFCFTGGLILADVMLPGANNVFGLWPALWTMGNLGRAGYGASLDGMWPYSYDACDIGAAPNQSYAFTAMASSKTGPPGATLPDGTPLSFLPGQRLSRCVCRGETHPGPFHKDGSYVGRSAPEIDVFEAQIGEDASGVNVGQVSQSAQWAPFNAEYHWLNTSDNLIIPSLDVSHFNNYVGGIYQQPTSVVSTTNQACYQLADGCFALQGFEYAPGFNKAYITWINNNAVAWTLNAGGVGGDTASGISARPITNEPLYILVNLGISPAFGFIDFEHLVFPATMRIDWIRVYQRRDAINVGCDPRDMPTQAYINTYIDAYTNPNYTTWTDDFGQRMPKNSLAGDC